MEQSIITSLLEILIGLLIFKPFRNFAQSIMKWITTTDINLESFIEFLKYHFPKTTELFEKYGKK